MIYLSFFAVVLSRSLIRSERGVNEFSASLFAKELRHEVLPKFYKFFVRNPCECTVFLPYLDRFPDMSEKPVPFRY